MNEIDPGNHKQLALFAAACCLAAWIHQFRAEAFDLPQEPWRGLDQQRRQMYIDAAINLLLRFRPATPEAVTQRDTDGGANHGQLVRWDSCQQNNGPVTVTNLCLYCGRAPIGCSYYPYCSKTCAMNAEREE